MDFTNDYNTSFIQGSGYPDNSLGNNGDSYVNNNNNNLYLKVENNWILTGDIRGDKGNKGDIGIDNDIPGFSVSYKLAYPDKIDANNIVIANNNSRYYYNYKYMYDNDTGIITIPTTGYWILTNNIVATSSQTSYFTTIYAAFLIDSKDPFYIGGIAYGINTRSCYNGSYNLYLTKGTSIRVELEYVIQHEQEERYDLLNLEMFFGMQLICATE
jgi:hypothetical protein